MIDIEAINASSLRVSWEEPLAEEQNGVITGYIINMTILETEERSSYSMAGTSFELYNLHPFYTYSVTIAAATVNGTGPYSAVFTIQLPPDGELQSMKLASIIGSFYKAQFYMIKACEH